MNKPYSSRRDLRAPILLIIEKLGGEATIPQIREELAIMLNVSDEFNYSTHSNGDEVFYKEIAWVLHGLQADEILDEEAPRGIHRLKIKPKTQQDSQNVFDDAASLTMTSVNECEQDEICNYYSELNLSKSELVEKIKGMKKSYADQIDINGTRYSRDNAKIAIIKLLRDRKCQICNIGIVKKDGSLYVEAAHITAKNENGDEEPDNILVLCPNHHKEFDYGLREIVNRNSEEVEFRLNGIIYKIRVGIP